MGDLTQKPQELAPRYSTNKEALEGDEGAPPKKAKRPKLYMRLDDGPTLDTTVVDDDAYKRHKKLEQELPKRKKNTGAIKSLMQSTYHHRHQWIVSQSPTVSEILTAFPALKSSIQVRVQIVVLDSGQHS